MAYARGAGTQLEGYDGIGLCGVPNGAATGAYALEGQVGIDYDGSVAVQVVHTGGVQNLSVGPTGANSGAAGGLAAGCFKAGQGRLCKAQVTTAGNGSVAMLIYDNALGNTTGNVIGVIKAAAAIGDQYTFDMPASLGLSIPAQANCPTVTLSWS